VFLTAVIALVGLLATSGDLFAQGRATINGVVTAPSGAPQPNVTLIVTTPQGVDRRAVTDASGAFVFGGLLPGAYRLRTDDETFAPFSQDQIALIAGQTLTLQIRLQARVPVEAPQTERAAIQGTVIGPNGQPLANVVVIITGNQGIDRRAVSDANGAYVFGGLQPGPYRLRIEDPGPDVRPFSVTDMTLAPGERRQFDIRLQPVPPPPPPPQAPPTPAPSAPRTTTPAPQAPERGTAPEPTEPGAVPEVTAPGGEFEAMPNRWDFKFPPYQRYSAARQMPWVIGSPFDPYNLNTAKADRPVGGSDSLFLNLNLQLNSTANPRAVGAGEADPTSQFFFNNNLVGGLELFRGDTVFQPKSWSIRGTVVANVNALSAGGNRQSDQTYGVEEAFAETRLAVLNQAFDFVSIRGGMQNFNSDFRGYVFVDNQLGVRLFGNARSNRDQYNVAFFSMRDRDAASQLHRFSSRDQTVVIANYYVQDFGVPGYTGMFNLHVNRDTKTSDDPAAPQVGALQVIYLGYHGDGRWGSWSVSHAFYQAFGKDDDNLVSQKLTGSVVAPVDVNARMAALELSRDADWYRYRGSFYYASGDSGNPGKATGFDTITDNPNLAGGQFMFWTQQKTAVAAGDGQLVISEKFSLLPNLRSKFTDRANFVNPGLMLVNGGIDLRVSPRLKIVTNLSYLRFADATILRQLAGPEKGFEDDAIGWDTSVGAKFRPFVNENLFALLGVSALTPRGGLATALGSGSLYSVVGAIQLAY
jgi:hypothetical protein